MKSLITGGAGFIGSNLAERLLREGHEVIVLDNLDPYYDPLIKKRNIHELKSKNFTFVKGSILNEPLLHKVMKDVDYVFHEAAQAGVGLSVKDPRKYLDINITGTLNILQTSLDAGVKNVINASSSSVYGRSLIPFKEDNQPIPISPYGVSKLAAEQYCRIFYELYKLRTTSLRYFTVYGPRMRPDLAISIFVQNALSNKPITIFGDGNFTRDFTYVNDVVDANLRAMKRGDGDMFNIGSGNRISVIEIANKIISFTRSKSKIVFSGTRQGDAKHTWADISKARKTLGWTPKVGLNEGLRMYIDYVMSANSTHSYTVKRLFKD